MSEAQNMDLLLIGGGFFGYAKEIISALGQRGRRVLWFEDRPGLDTVTKSLLRLAPTLVAARSEAYFDHIISRSRNHPIMDVLVIKGEAMSCTAIKKLRVSLPTARFTLYFWDSYLNMPRGSQQKVALFDQAFTFDPSDAAADGRLRYRPLFYSPDYIAPSPVKPDIDLLFIGTAHSDRYAILRKLRNQLPSSIRFERVLYFPSKAVYAARRVFDPDFWGARRGEFVFEPLTRADILSLIARTRAVVDIERTTQRGLTMRTVEMFGAGKKLVTTNAAIEHTDMYNSNNITIIDRRRPSISVDFLSTPYVPPSPQLLARYTLGSWLNEVLPPRG